MSRTPGDRAADPCPCCYDGETQVSTGFVLGQPCVVCHGTGRRPPRVGEPFEPLSCGYNVNADEPGEVYDAEMHPISGNHIAMNPDGTITPFRGRGGRLN